MFYIIRFTQLFLMFVYVHMKFIRIQAVLVIIMVYLHLFKLFIVNILIKKIQKGVKK